jgi:zinc transport system substrate-binding protein
MAGSDLKVVVSIKPFHSLVSAVMQGVSEPILLLNGNSSPHSFSLRPSDAESLQNATLVFWGGERLEQFLAKPIHSLATSAKLVSLQETPGLRFWPLRSGRNSQKIEKEAGLNRQRSNENENGWPLGVDPHIWLDPINAKMITQNIAQMCGSTPRGQPFSFSFER